MAEDALCLHMSDLSEPDDMEETLPADDLDNGAMDPLKSCIPSQNEEIQTAPSTGELYSLYKNVSDKTAKFKPSKLTDDNNNNDNESMSLKILHTGSEVVENGSIMADDCDSDQSDSILRSDVELASAIIDQEKYLSTVQNVATEQDFSGETLEIQSGGYTISTSEGCSVVNFQETEIFPNEPCSDIADDINSTANDVTMTINEMNTDESLFSSSAQESECDGNHKTEIFENDVSLSGSFLNCSEECIPVSPNQSGYTLNIHKGTFKLAFDKSFVPESPCTVGDTSASQASTIFDDEELVSDSICEETLEELYDDQTENKTYDTTESSQNKEKLENSTEIVDDLESDKENGIPENQVNLTMEGAIQFLKEKLHLVDIDNKLSGNKFQLLSEIVDKWIHNVPVHNLHQLRRDPLDRCMPHLADDVQNVFEGQGGSVWINVCALHHVLKCLKFDSRLTLAYMENNKAYSHWMKNSPSHVVLMIQNVSKPGDIFLVDVGSDQPCLAPVPLDFECSSPIYDHPLQPYKIIKVGDRFERLNLTKDCVDEMKQEYFEIKDDTWASYYSFTLQTEQDFEEIMHEIDFYLYSDLSNAFNNYISISFYKSSQECSMIKRNSMITRNETGSDVISLKTKAEYIQAISKHCRWFDTLLIEESLSNTREVLMGNDEME